MQRKAYCETSVKQGSCVKSRLVSWKEAIKKHPNVEDVAGYSTAKDISEKVGLAISSTTRTLEKMRKEGKIECLRAKVKTGHLVWMYKD